MLQGILCRSLNNEQKINPFKVPIVTDIGWYDLYIATMRMSYVVLLASSTSTDILRVPPFTVFHYEKVFTLVI